MHVVSVVGARPQFVKLAPISAAARAAGVEHTIVHTGQHYDRIMSDVFFEDLEIPTPAVNLGVGSGSHGVQTGAMLAALDDVFAGYAPDWVLVYGDTNSTLAAALSAVKLHLPVAHLEAGLRSFNRAMPEEHNRILTDHAADVLLAPTQVAMGHLADEGLAARSLLVGDVMADILLSVKDRLAGLTDAVDKLGCAPGEFYVATIHRAENTDDPSRLKGIVDALASLDKPVALLAHPRLVVTARQHGIQLTRGGLHHHEPLGYSDLMAVVAASAGVVTDSGGLQKEAFLLRVPCTTVRGETEWVETLADGWNVLAPLPEEIAVAASRRRPADTGAMPFGDGHAAEKVMAALLA